METGQNTELWMRLMGFPVDLDDESTSNWAVPGMAKAFSLSAGIRFKVAEQREPSLYE